MTVYKRNGNYYIKGNIRKMDGTLAYYHRKANNVRTLKEAKNYEVDFLRKYQDIEVSKTQITFQALCDKYLKQYTGVKNSSKIRKTQLLKKICDNYGKEKINLITVKSLRKYIADQEARYSSEYCDAIFYALKNVFEFAVYESYLEISPMAKVKRNVNINSVKKEMNFWEQEQFNIFMQYVDNQEARTIFTFLYYMGVRKGELRALQWKDVDFVNNIVKIYKTAPQLAKSVDDLTAPKTTNSNRNITMPNNVIKSLKEWKDTQKQIYGFNEDCFVFGFFRPEAPENMRRWLKNGIKAANEDGHDLPEIRVHDFRHSHASYLINNMSDKFTDFDIAKRLGDTISTLHSTYAHWFKQADKNIIEFMNTDAKESAKADNTESNKYSELVELKKLLDMDIITQEEFNQKKKQVLGI